MRHSQIGGALDIYFFYLTTLCHKKKEIIRIRLRLIIYLSSLLILGTVIYIIQIIYNIDS